MGYVFLIYSSCCLLFVYRNVTDFCTLILYPAALLNWFVSAICVCGGSIFASQVLVVKNPLANAGNKRLRFNP